MGAVVYGVSKDSLSSHEKFATKYNLNMSLLSDVDKSVCDAYGVLREKVNFGKTSVGVVRTTFVIGVDGKIAMLYPNVKVNGHAQTVLDFVRQM